MQKLDDWPDKPIVTEMSDIIQQKDAEIERLKGSYDDAIGEARLEEQDLRKQIAALKERIKELENPEVLVTEAHYVNGVLDVRASFPLFSFLMDECSKMFDEQGATNYLSIAAADKNGRTFEIIIQLSSGMTPAEMNIKLKTQIKELEASNRKLREAMLKIRNNHMIGNVEATITCSGCQEDFDIAKAALEG